MVFKRSHKIESFWFSFFFWMFRSLLFSQVYCPEISVIFYSFLSMSQKTAPDRMFDISSFIENNETEQSCNLYRIMKLIWFVWRLMRFKKKLFSLFIEFVHQTFIQFIIQLISLGLKSKLMKKIFSKRMNFLWWKKKRGNSEDGLSTNEI